MSNNKPKTQKLKNLTRFSQLFKPMKLLGEKLVSNRPGTITIIPEKPDDLWILFNLIANGDVVSALTTRKIQFSSDNATNKKNNSRVQLEIELKVTAVDYEKDCSIIRLSGKTIKFGIFHTLELKIKKQFSLSKKRWDEETIRALKDGSGQNGTKNDLGIILMKDRLAEILLVNKTTSTTTHCATIRCEKRYLEKFYDNLFVSFMKHIDMNVISYVVIASNDSMKDDFRAYMSLEAQRWKIKSIESNKSRILMVNKSNVKDILSDQVVTNVIKSTTKTEINTKVFEEFMNMVLNKYDRICYGTKNVEYAHELLAIETLLITEEILENKDVKLRKKYSRLTKSVQEAGGKVVQFSDVEGDRLAQMTGIAAILRFPIPDDLVL